MKARSRPRAGSGRPGPRHAGRTRGAILGILLLAACRPLEPPPARPAIPAPRETPVPAEVLLQRLSRTAQLFRDTALQFTCKETISWSGPGMSADGTRFEYLFVYDEKEGFRDYRTAVAVGPRRNAPREINPRERGVPRYLHSAYLWIFAFRESRQPLHRYRVLGSEEVLGIPAVKILFEPIPPYRYQLNDWAGVAWVDPSLGQLLKVVAQRPFDYERRSALETRPEDEKVEEIRATFEVITTWFSEAKNGLRFPGLVEIDQSRYLWRGADLSRRDAERLRRRAFEEWTSGDGKVRVRRSGYLKVRQKYHDYEFFSVRTADEIGDFILDGKAPGG